MVGFEAVIAGHLLGVQIQNRGKLKDCCLDCCQGSGHEGHCGAGREFGCCGSSSQDMQCTNGEEGDGCTGHCFVLFLDNDGMCLLLALQFIGAKENGFKSQQLL